ncbi:MAG: D-2-hydroxyacid dehydrogenase [Gammaproteobacteria bacterium]|nr:D-2-hydroxyacid dehydrogenase [Gammaproteobacteria bacterium]NND36503.1 D-2-hydroxyacid dehydrogenase [Gammaproteobacteria bacterium]
MRAVFLDFDTVGPGDIDIAPLLKHLPDLELYAHTPADQVAERISGAEVVLINKVRLDATTLTDAQDLRLVCLAATGIDNVDIAAAKEHGIAVCNIRNYCTPSVVQHVFTLILALTNHVIEYRELLRDRAWADSAQFCMLDFPIRELDGKTLGIVGLGALGSAVASVGAAFGMRVLAARRPYRGTASAGGTQYSDDTDLITRVPLGDLLQTADIVSLHCPLTDETSNLIDAHALSMMRKDALLINTARGGLVDSFALVEAVRNGIIGGAGIDVLRQEPPTGPEPLLDNDLDNLIVTPHIAWAARESRQRALDDITKNIAAFMRGETLNRVDL